jgi:membrane protein DedA with SNARE-associated domain
LLKKKYGFYIQKGEKFFEKYGAVSVFIGRFVGVTRPVVPFVAGLLNMNRALFVVYSLLSGILWAISYYGTGYLFGAGLSYWNFSGLELTVLIIAVLIFCYYRYKKKDLFDDKS